MGISRRRVLETCTTAGGALLAAGPRAWAFDPVSVENPLGAYGSHQSITRNWMMPIHQTDTLFHKKTGGMGFVFGFDVDNHAINTVPKETLIRITKAEDGGIGGKGPWEPSRLAVTPGKHTEQNQLYLTGGYTKIQG